MNKVLEVLKVFIKGFIEGVKETPRLYFAPIVIPVKAIYRKVTSRK